MVGEIWEVLFLSSFFRSSFLSFVSKYIFTCSLSGLRLGIHLKHIYNGGRAKICFWLSQTNQAPWSWGAGRKRYELLKGSGTETDLLVLPTGAAHLSPRSCHYWLGRLGLCLINFPATLFREFMGGDATPSSIVLSRHPGEFERGVGRGTQVHSSPRPKGKPPHREHSCRKMKNILLFKEEQKVAGHG